MSVYVKDNLIISGSDDCTVRIWNIDSGECLKTLECYSIWFNSVFVKDNLIITFYFNRKIRIIPISLFPRELGLYQSTINSFNLAHHLECEIQDYLTGNIDL